MSTLREAVQSYLTLRRSLGFKLRVPGGLLDRFAEFVDAEGKTYITTELALRWAQQPADALPSTQAWRMGIVRRFATWHCGTDHRTEVPPEGLLPDRYCRKPPYIYTDEEIERLMQATNSLPSSKGLRAVTYSTLFGLLAVTGMRVSEALNLDRKDVDLAGAVLAVERSKFGKSRLVPVHASTREALKRYAGKRDGIVPRLSTPAFFVTERRTRVSECNARYTFAKVSQKIGLRQATSGHGRGPRLHDMRHRFAAKTLINWYRAGLDVERQIPKLATYLGHVHVNDTYWYLQAVPELLQLATERVARRHKEIRS
jgi:integrase